MSQRHETDILIIGGGSAGISVAARLAAETASAPAASKPRISLVEPASVHYYQPLWTLVGGGVFPKEDSARPMADLIPAGVTWLRDEVVAFTPEAHSVTLRSGTEVTYDQVVVAPGIQLDWGRIEGLEGHLGRGGICSNYSYDHVDSTWEAIRTFRGGEALFTFPSTPIKCAGAPQKIMWLAEHYFRKAGVRDKSVVRFVSAAARIFGVDRYARVLEGLATERGVVTQFKRDLVAVRPERREAVFQVLGAPGASPSTETVPYDLLHITPPMSAPEVVKKSSLANADGWVDVDMYTCQHVRHADVFALGDASSLPCSKTGAAIRKQAPVVVDNLLARRSGAALTARYDGYASCPLVTGYGRLILAEFGYGGAIMETFPFDQSRERASMYALKVHALPKLYWHGMLRGRA